MRIVAIIPARYKSSRFEGKPLADIHGMPMIWWVYQQVKKAKGLDEVYVATDDELIKAVCNDFGMRVIMTSSNHATGTDRLAEVAKKISADYYVNIQGDEPLIEPENINLIVDFFKSYPEIDLVNTMSFIDSEEDVLRNTVVKVVTDPRDNCLYLSRAPIPMSKNGLVKNYYKHLGLYGLKKDILLKFGEFSQSKNELIEDIEMLRFLDNGFKIKMLKVKSKSVAVDRPEDIHKVEMIMNLGSKEFLKLNIGGQ